MFDYLSKFNNLPQELRDQVSNPEALAAVSDLEKIYGLDLTPIIIKVMVRDIKIGALAVYLAGEFGLSQERAEALSKNLKDKIFMPVAAYLGMPLAAPISVPAASPASATPAPVTPAPIVSAPIIPAPKTAAAPVPEAAGKENVAMPEILDDSYTPKVEVAAADLIRAANIKINPELFFRLQTILKLYLRGVREKIDTRALLMKSEAEGGVDFDAEKTDKFLLLAETAKNSLHKSAASLKRPAANILEKINKLGQAEVYDLRKVLDTKHELTGGLDLDHELETPQMPMVSKGDISGHGENQPIKIENLEEALAATEKTAPAGLTTPAPLAPPVPIRPAAAPLDYKFAIPEIKTPSQPAPKTSAPASKFGASFAKSAADASGRSVSSKPRIEDIKKVRIMNPIDELRFMDIVNFRRLAPTPDEIVQKIKTRIKLLESEDYEKGLAGIAAWRQCPVSKLYLKIVSLSANRGVTIPALIEELKQQNQDYLTLPEIEAIISLNAGLRN